MFVLVYATSGSVPSFGFHRSLTHRSLAYQATGIRHGSAQNARIARRPDQWVRPSGPSCSFRSGRRSRHNADASASPVPISSGCFFQSPWQRTRRRIRSASTDFNRRSYYVFLERNQLQLQLAVTLLCAFGAGPGIIWGTFVRSVLVYTSHGLYIVPATRPAIVRSVPRTARQTAGGSPCSLGRGMAQ